MAIQYHRQSHSVYAREPYTSNPPSFRAEGGLPAGHRHSRDPFGYSDGQGPTSIPVFPGNGEEGLDVAKASRPSASAQDHYIGGTYPAPSSTSTVRVPRGEDLSPHINAGLPLEDYT